MKRLGFTLAACLVLGVASIAVGAGPFSPDGEAPRGCSASNVDYYYNPDTGLIDGKRMAELTWIPVSASDSATVIGCVPNVLWDPTLDENRALLSYGRGDYDIPLPIFGFNGELVAYFVVYKGAVPIAEAVANGDVPEFIVEDPPEATDFDPEFVPISPPG